ncbi:MAG: WhiB family transcriptional regulator, partial [Gammaproteobacteria bacterium]|nr:WhiB family transcriptional regulator [Gammaproteobacteria bacterium]
MHSAACRGSGPVAFFHPDGIGRAPWEPDDARSVCAGCEVRVDCLAYAYATGERHGVWGGLTPHERGIDFRKGRHRAVCGTPWGAIGHRSRGEPLCEACRTAETFKT